MKNLIVVLIMIFAVTISAQEKNAKIPNKVIESFTSSHPNIKKLIWDKEGNNYEANYEQDGKKYSAVVDKKGNILETETDIDISELPKGAEKYIKQNYKGYKLSGAAKIVDDKNNVKYEAEISKDKVHKDVIFDKSGKPIEKMNMNKEKEEKDEKGEKEEQEEQEEGKD